MLYNKFSYCNKLQPLQETIYWIQYELLQLILISLLLYSITAQIQQQLKLRSFYSLLYAATEVRKISRSHNSYCKNIVFLNPIASKNTHTLDFLKSGIEPVSLILLGNKLTIAPWVVVTTSSAVIATGAVNKHSNTFTATALQYIKAQLPMLFTPSYSCGCYLVFLSLYFL